MGGLIRNSIILLSVSYVQHCIVMATGAVHIGGVDFCGRVDKIRSITTGAKKPYKTTRIVGQNQYKGDVVEHYCTTKPRVHGERASLRHSQIEYERKPWR